MGTDQTCMADNKIHVAHMQTTSAPGTLLYEIVFYTDDVLRYTPRHISVYFTTTVCVKHKTSIMLNISIQLD